MYRDEQRRAVIAEGFSGKDISSQLGERWRRLSTREKNAYKVQAKIRASFVSNLREEPNILDRSVTVSSRARSHSINNSRRNSV